MKLSTALFVSSGIAVLFAAMPFLSTFAAAAIASMSGCALDEGSAHSCVLFGFDAGQTLYTMGVAFWLFIFTWLYLPVAIRFIVAGFIVLARGVKDPARNRKVGLVYWLLFFAAMILPVGHVFALPFVLLAMFLGYWRKRQAATNALT